jgi:mono/diheme cytochrome c family protein
MKTVIRFALQIGMALLAARSCVFAEAPLDRTPAKFRGRVNPYEKKAGARAAGEKLFQRECAECHGVGATGLRKAPPLTIVAVTNAPPGAIFWVLRNGSLYRGMPSFAHIPEPQKWQIVTYLRSLGNDRSTK